MSNARYFAHGTDFYRVLYDNGSVDGPYIRPGSARGVGNRKTAPRYRYRWTEDNERYEEEWFIHKSYKLQKLSSVDSECPESGLCFKTPAGSMCWGNHGHELKWMDVD